MCGIYFCYCCCRESGSDGNLLDEFQASCLELIKNRGPDYQGELLENNVFCYSSVLWLQGASVCRQPVVTHDNSPATTTTSPATTTNSPATTTTSPHSLLQWNGDIYTYNGKPLPTAEGISDTAFLSRRLAACTSDSEILACFQAIHGPWAFVYWQRAAKRLWFGRDFFGRQSLLVHQTANRLLLTSVARQSDRFPCVELPAVGIYCLDLTTTTTNLAAPLVFPWSSLSPEDYPPGFCYSDTVLRPPVDFAEIIQNPGRAEEELPGLHCGIDCGAETVFDRLLAVPRVMGRVQELLARLQEAVSRRVRIQPGLCRDCVKTQTLCDHPSVAVLFSGGLDSAILTFLTCQLLSDDSSRPVDLLNVAFQQADGGFNVPDRLTGLQALKEIQELLPSSRLNFVCVDVTKAELKEARAQQIRHLLHPLNTVLDDSIGCAIWFAARGWGSLYREADEDNRGSTEAVEDCRGLAEAVSSYTSPARVVIAGMGIDEQLGGYSRHRVRYEREGVAGLEEELKMELERISHRNLGRDNRMVSDHGVMARFPFLDEDLVNFLSGLETGLKANFFYPRGVGEKLILRLAAHHLGLRLTAREPKRAVQFGSRIAKLENRKEKANHVALRDNCQ